MGSQASSDSTIILPFINNGSVHNYASDTIKLCS